MRKVLWWLIGGARGGRNRMRIVYALDEQPMNTNQLSKALDLDYKTVQHHLELLEANNVLMTMGDDYGKTYFLTDRMEANMDVLDEIAAEASFVADADPTDPDDGPGDVDDGPGDIDDGPGDVDG